MTQQTHKPNETERRAKIDSAIEASIQPSPDSAHTIAALLDEHPTLVARRYHKRFIFRSGRWVYRHSEDKPE